MALAGAFQINGMVFPCRQPIHQTEVVSYRFVIGPGALLRLAFGSTVWHSNLDIRGKIHSQ